MCYIIIMVNSRKKERTSISEIAIENSIKSHVYFKEANHNIFLSKTIEKKVMRFFYLGMKICLCLVSIQYLSRLTYVDE